MSTVNSNSPVNNVLALNGVDKAGMDLETMITLVLSEKQQIFEAQVQGLVKNMQSKNDRLKALGEIAARITARQKEFPKDAKSNTMINKFEGTPDWETRRTALLVDAGKGDWAAARKTVENSTWDAASKARALEDIELAEYAAQYGVNTGDGGNPLAFAVGGMNQGSLEALQAQIKASTDSLGNESQMDQIALQSAMNKMQNTSQLLSTVIKKFDDLKGSIVRNV